MTLALATLAVPMAGTAHASTALQRSVAQNRLCFLHPFTHRARVTVCGGNYVDVLLAANARRVQYQVASGIARARGTRIEACQCGAHKLLVNAQAKATYTRRKFADWWANPGTMPGRRLKGCLKNAALALAGELALTLAGRKWDDKEVVAVTAFACGAGAVVDA
jgi:hypothetical protein